MFVYNSEGVVTNTIDYMVALPCLDRVVYGKKRKFSKTKLNKNKDLMLSTLEAIQDKQFIRDAIELCDLGINASLIPLPYEYSKIVGRKNNRNVIAFNLRYFLEQCVTKAERDRKLKKYPSEIRKAYSNWEKG